MVTLTELAAREVKGIIERQDETAKKKARKHLAFICGSASKAEDAAVSTTRSI